MRKAGMERPSLAKNRFESLVHYVCAVADTPKLGATKLNKILWFVDATAYRMWGQSISGETAYIKLQHGPVPRNILKTLENLERKKLVSVSKITRYGKPQTEFTSLKDPDISVFTGEERALITGIAHKICHEHSASSISEASHDILWKVTRIGQDMPFKAMLACEAAEITKEDIEWADDVIKQGIGP